jgi:hypothetical protein
MERWTVALIGNDMTRELELQFVARWPTWFRLDGDPRKTGMVDGFRCGDGWFQLIWRLCEDLEPLVRDLEHSTENCFEILQVKEKFGELRIYCNVYSVEIEERMRPQFSSPSHFC